jgi:hypothetical protein
VLIVDEEDRLRIRDVDVARAERDRVYIQSGLAPADRVTVSQIETVVDGMRVRTTVEPPFLAPVAEPEVGP